MELKSYRAVDGRFTFIIRAYGIEQAIAWVQDWCRTTYGIKDYHFLPQNIEELEDEPGILSIHG